MKKAALSLSVIFLFSIYFVVAQKKSLSHDDYNKWEMIYDTEISFDGSHAMYQQNPQREDGKLVIHNIRTGKNVFIPRGANARFSPGGGFAVFHIEPPLQLLRQARVEKRPSSRMPKDSLGIFLFQFGLIAKYEDVRSYQLPAAGSSWLAFSLNIKKTVSVPEPESAPLASLVDSLPVLSISLKEEKPVEVKTENLKQLVVTNPVVGQIHTFDDVESYRISDNGKSVLFYREKSSSGNSSVPGMYVFDTQTGTTTLLDSVSGKTKYLTVSKDGLVFSWLQSGKVSDKKSEYSLIVCTAGEHVTKQVITSSAAGMPDKYIVSEHRSLIVSDDNKRIFFGIAPLVAEQPVDTLLEAEKFSVDIWHWQDAQLQSQQQVNLRRVQTQSFETVFHIPTGKIVPLADSCHPGAVIDKFGTSDKIMGYSELSYQREASWVGYTARDVSVVDVNTGKRTPVLTRAEATAALSLHGKYILYYNPKERNWFSWSVKDSITTNLTHDLGVVFFDEKNDEPSFESPYGFCGWGNNDEYVYIYDRYDIWKIDPSGSEKAVNITDGYGRENNIILRYQKVDSRNAHISDERIWLNAFNDKNKQSGYYSLDMKSLQLTSLVMDDASFTQLKKAPDADQFIWRRGSFTDYPNVYKSNLSFTEISRISSANTFQSQYRWGKVELVEWNDFNNQTLQGLLYFPEDFDPEAKYPMIVNFYEKSSDELHVHSIPSPSYSVINPTYCTSNGYIVFIPDITYETGAPGHSAYNAIVSGTYAMSERYKFIDKENIGLQGQSWGGYQIAYLITRTNMFKAAMAGAPVANMTSAYGGIRWETGIVRQFQYEQAQSRMGGTLWDKPLQYIENSPIFYAADIKTPLLIMANDNDGSVPWYQSIELFTALRRLDKPVWMLVYNDESHNLRQWPARIDFSIRMQQYFDHYLKQAPAPEWLVKGIPYSRKGIDNGYRLVN